MQHDDDVRTGGQGLAIAGLLVAPITIIAVVLEDDQSEAACDVHCLVRAVVVDENADVHQIGQLSHGDLEGLLRVISGHNDRDALAVDHGQ